MATSYWNPTSGNDSNDGLSVANAKLTIGAAETVAGLGGTVIVTSGTHSLSGLLNFAGGRTYTSENPKNKSHLQWSFVNGDRIFFATVSTNKGILRDLKITGLRYNGAAPIESSGTGDIDMISNEFDTYGDWLGGGQFWMGGSTINGTCQFLYNKVNAYVNRGTSVGFLFRSITNFICQNNSFYVTGLNDTSLHAAQGITNLTFDNNILEVEISLTILFTATTTLSRTGNIYWGDNGTLALVNDEQRVNPLLIDPANANFTLLPNSPAITSGGVSGLPDLTGYTNVLWCHPSGTATGAPDADNSGTTDPAPVSNVDYYSFAGALAQAASGDAIVFKDGTYSGAALTLKAGVDLIGETRYGATISRTGIVTVPVGTSTLRNLIFNVSTTNSSVSGSNQSTCILSLIQCKSTLTPSNYAGFGTLTLNLSFSLLYLDKRGLSGSPMTAVTLNSVASTIIIPSTASSYTADTLASGTYNLLSTVIRNLAASTINVGTIASESDSHISGFSDRDDGDPLFIDPSNNNLNLLPNSPAITSGSGSGDVYTGETADTWFDPTKTGSTSTGADPANAFGRDELAALQSAIQAVGDGCIVGVKDGTMPATSISWASNLSGMDVRFVAQTKYGVVFNSLTSAQFWQLDTSVGKTTSLEGFKIQNSRITGFTGTVFNDRNVAGCTTLYKDWIAVNVSTLNSNMGLFGTTSAASTIILENVSIYADNATGGMFSYQYSANPTIILRRCNIVWRSKLSYDLQIEQSNLVNEGVSVLATTVTPTVDSISNIINFSTQSQGSAPLFIDAANGNFNMLPNSPAITA